MQTTAEITAADVRQNLLDRARAYAERTRTSFSAISQAAVQDSKFLANVERGSNFTIKTYQRVIDWIDAAEASERAA